MAKSTLVQSYELTLILNKNEAEALAAVLSHIGGDPETTARKYIDDIIRTLDDQKVDYKAKNHFERINGSTTFYFTDKSLDKSDTEMIPK